MGVEITEDQRSNAESIYSLIRYGYTGGSGSFEGADVPFIGADGFRSPIGENWRSVVTSEFGNRIDPITGERRGHTGMDLAVPTGTPIRAALPGTVTVSTYNRGGYGYYIMIDHGNGLSTLYGHCSQLLASVGRTVKAGDVIEVAESSRSSEVFKRLTGQDAPMFLLPAWMEREKNTLKGTVIRLPAREDIDVPVEEHLIVELYSK